jgi:hypothetical protein
VLATVAKFAWVLHLRDLQITRILIEVLVGIDEGGRELAMRRCMQGTSVRLQGPCHAPPALFLLPAMVVASPHPH